MKACDSVGNQFPRFLTIHNATDSKKEMFKNTMCHTLIYNIYNAILGKLLSYKTIKTFGK